MGKASKIAAAAAKIKNVSSTDHKTTEITKSTTSFLPPLPSEMVAQREAETGVVMTDEERLAAIQAAAEEAPVVPTIVTNPEPTPTSTEIKGRRIRYNTTDIIVVRKSNPKRPGTAGHARFAVYQTGMVVEEYMKDRRVGKFARADLAWDIDRGFIEVVPKSDLEEALKKEYVPASTTAPVEMVNTAPIVIEPESAEVAA